ncbi:hypothetical protein [Janibacter sp. G56]|uniref:hypothetical protein n=1 Tax=Janibacter sp. G56 TaxID=3418717 RepID=UPI003D05190E
MSLETAGLLGLLVAFAYGFASALVPVLNAEVFVVAAVAANRATWYAPVIALTAGQTVGKVVIFEAARHGASWLPTWERRTGLDAEELAEGEEEVVKQDAADAPDGLATRMRHTLRRWSARMLELLDGRWTGGGVVLAAASVGIPPLAVVAVVAGVRKLGVVVFTLTCFVGRLVRFAAVAWPVVVAAGATG